LAAVSGGLFVLTLFWHDWLESLGLDPDDHNGTAEWLIVAGLFVLCAVFAVSARLEWRRPSPRNSARRRQRGNDATTETRAVVGRGGRSQEGRRSEEGRCGEAGRLS
jgi:hypothetical protein